MIADVGQAFVNADIDDVTWIWLPNELSYYSVVTKEHGKIVLKTSRPYKLLRALYGYRKAPLLWQDHLTALFVEVGLKTFVFRCGGVL